MLFGSLHRWHSTQNGRCFKAYNVTSSISLGLQPKTIQAEKEAGFEQNAVLEHRAETTLREYTAA